jgi:hypothetical protein
MDAVIESSSREQLEKLYLNEERILGDKVGLATCEVYGGTENNRVMGGLGEMQEAVFKESAETAEQLGQPLKECARELIPGKLSKAINRSYLVF